MVFIVFKGNCELAGRTAEEVYLNLPSAGRSPEALSWTQLSDPSPACGGAARAARAAGRRRGGGGGGARRG
ncbi:hypothetical protein, partial [Nocardia cyriacigeorgica]|uniref:hypothetical protein n=1 Tax=Nocardia cyriacigeorgica TaxID=135487 RepID=UPI002456C427